MPLCLLAMPVSGVSLGRTSLSGMFLTTHMSE